MKRTAEDLLNYMKTLLENYLHELNAAAGEDFAYGEKTAYVECLEMIQTWENAPTLLNLNYDIEKRFPL